MKFALALAAVVASISSFVSAHPLDMRDLNPRANVIITTGALGNTAYPRREIRDLLNNYPNQWTLFILAMQQWQTQSQSDPSSYFGISSIHGVPKNNYNNVGRCNGCTDTNVYGYCTHSMVLFPAWHRVYLAHFEQRFLEIVHGLVSQFPQSRQAIMQSAANQIRFPYWDWAIHPQPGLPAIPKVITDTTMSINGPKGQQTIFNPLYQSSINNPGDMLFFAFNSYKNTIRYPTTNDASSQSQESKVTATFDNIRQSLQDQVYTLLTACGDYLYFSNDAAGGPGGCYTSLEGIHNTVHQQSGGAPSNGISGGHMYYLPTAAFDPVFWLHHAMVDRVFALWQTLHPNSYGATQVTQGQTWTINKGTTLTPSSPLTPFYKDNRGNFWNTNDVRNWASTFRYTYPEYINSDGSSAAIASYVNKLYGPQATQTAGKPSKRAAEAEPGFVNGLLSAVTSALPLPTGTLKGTLNGNPLVATNGSTFQYYANVKAPAFTMNGSYTVYVFHGQPRCEDPADWPLDPSLISPVGILSQGGHQHNDALVTGAVPLTRVLSESVSSGALLGLTQALVTPYLKQHLTWRVSGIDGQAVDPSTIIGLEVSVTSSTATRPGSEFEIPSFSEFVTLPEITKGKSGGLNNTLTWAATSVSEVLNKLKTVVDDCDKA